MVCRTRSADRALADRAPCAISTQRAASRRPAYRPAAEGLQADGDGTRRADASLREALRSITDPASGKDIVTAGLVEGIELRGSLVQVALLTDRAHAEAMEPVRRAVEALLARQPGITNATAVLTAHKAPAPRRRAGDLRARARPRPEAAAAAAGREGDRRGGVRQGRRRQVDRRGQPGGVAGARRASDRTAGRRHLRPEPAAHAGAVAQAGGARGQDDPAAGLGAVLHVDRLPGRRGDADDLARPDGDGRAGADDGRSSRRSPSCSRLPRT